MAEAVAVHEAPALRPRDGSRRYGSRIPWDRYANGATWKLTREHDWPNVKTSLQVVEMAERAAKRLNMSLEEYHEADTVWVKFVKAENPFQES